jgi:hypothetical protein
MSLRPMSPRSLPAATLAAIVLLAFACPAASAHAAGDAPAATSGSGAAEAPAAEDPEAPAPADTTGGGIQTLAQGAQSAADEQGEVLSGSTAAQQGGREAPPAPPTSPPEAAPATPAPPADQGEEATTTATHSTADPPPPSEQPSRGDPRPLPPPPPSTPPKVEVSKVVPTSTAPDLPTATAPDLPTATAPPPEPSVPTPIGGAPAPAPKRGNKLARLLTDADRGLREVHGQIGTLKRRLGAGDLPPTAGLVRLRQGLDRLAPVLLALEARLVTAPRLTPRLKALLHRVHSRLEQTQDSAGDMITAFVRSGAGGPALRLLLRELERFVAFASMPAPTPGATRGATPAPGPLGALAPGPLGAPEPDPYPAYTQIEAAPAAAPRDGVTALSPGRRGDGRHRAGHKVPGGPDHVPPSSPASASASATPGGAFFAAGLGALAALVAALARPALRVRLELVAGRPYRAAFPSPLERPG